MQSITVANTAKDSEMKTLTNIDALGSLLAQIAELQAQADAIKDSLKDQASLSGEKVFEGELFKATYVESNRSTVDWKAISKVMNIPADLIAANTKTAAVFSVKVTSR
jgi:hypothetical protein